MAISGAVLIPKGLSWFDFCGVLIRFRSTMGKSLVYIFYGYGGGDALPDVLKLIAMGVLAVALVIFLMRKTSN